MRLEGEQPQQDAGDNRTTVEAERGSAENGRRQERVLAVPYGDEHRGKGEDGNEADRAFADAADDRLIGEARDGEPDRERREIGRGRQRPADQQIGRRIEEWIKAGLRAELVFLDRILARHVVDGGRLARQRQFRSRPEIGEIRAERLAARIDHAVGGHEHRQQRQ
ncbi:MAG: hypothetical protein V9G24_12065 [Rhodoblastus sp.]